MPIEKYLLEQVSLHPSMQPQDVVKLCYQASFGAEHLLTDFTGAESYFVSEFEAVPAVDMPLYENISGDFARVNMCAWKHRGLPASWLFNMFKASAAPNPEGERIMVENLESAAALADEFPFSKEEFLSYVNQYEQQGLRPVHHSDIYRAVEKPAYRIVRAELLSLIDPLEKIAARSRRPCVIAIDGRAGAGKSGLAARLSMVLGCDIVHMDDFFLPPELRSDERLDAAGGNIHYERFKAEALPMLHSAEPFSYNVFSCSEMKLSGKREMGAGEYRIVEGSYSLHPEFGDYADVRIFCQVEPEEQLRRITERDGEHFAKIFRERWIPMEEKYFDTFSIAEKCDVVM